jgi:hypothetical protein
MPVDDNRDMPSAERLAPIERTARSVGGPPKEISCDISANAPGIAEEEIPVG